MAIDNFESYRLLFECNPNPMVVSDRKTLRYIAVNEAAVRHYGYSRSEWLKMTLYDIRPSDEASRLRRYRIEDGLSSCGIWNHRKKGGAIIQVEVTACSLMFQGRPALLGMLRDVTEERKLRVIEERFSGIFNAARDGMSFVSQDGTLLAVNDALCRMLGYTRVELLSGKTFLSLTAPDYRPMNRAAIEQVLATGEPAEFEKEYVRKDGSRVPVSVTAFRVQGSHGRPAGSAAIVRDITERKRLEKEILEIGAREQSRIGRELHDSLGQHLTGISFLAKSLKTSLSRRGAQESRLAERIAQAAGEAVEQVKALAAGLVPAELLPNGLPGALRALAAQAEKTFGIECSFSGPKATIRMEDASLLHFYRIAQEAVNNAAKHSGAGKIRIALREAEARIVLEISDDGKGLKRGKGKGLGLKIMAHRARMLDGVFEARCGDNGGTVIVCSCPAKRSLL